MERHSYYDIQDYGAIGDGSQVNTTSIQCAIDACRERGGGRVNIPPGVFLTGSLVLGSFVQLHLEAGATLLASPNRDDYRQHFHLPKDVDPQNRYGRNSFCNLIHAHDADGVSITGRGTIDGNGRAFFGPPTGPGRHKDPGEWRPGHLIALVKCRDVLIQDVRIIDSPLYTIWPRTCNRVRITGITILNDPLGPNTDGIDPDCCQDVVISNCVIDAGDDCIAVKSDGDWLSPTQPADGLVVTNCILKSTACGIRIGYEGDSPIRNCTFSNLVMQRTDTGINMVVPAAPDRNIQYGPSIENISFSNIVMDARLPFFLWIGDQVARPGCIRNICISDVQATAERASYIGGNAQNPVEAIRLRNIRLTMRGEMNGEEICEPVPFPYSVWDYWPEHLDTWPQGNARFKGLPFGLYARHVHDLDIKGLRIDWSNASGDWHAGLCVEQGRDVRMSDFRSEGIPGRNGAAVRVEGEHPVIT